MKIISQSADETFKVGEFLAQTIVENEDPDSLSGGALVIALGGELGSGKTVLVQGLARGLKVKEKVVSPTFVILKKYELLLENRGLKHFYHIDCYRLTKPGDADDLGLKEIMTSGGNIVAIEWAERIKKILPKRLLQIDLKYSGKNKRTIFVRL